MPLVDEHSERLDRRSPVWRAWLAVAVGLVLLWVVFSFGVTWFAGVQRENGPASSPAAQLQGQTLANAQQQLSWGDAAGAAQVVANIDSQRLTVMDKHTYLKVGAEAYARTGSPAAAARLLDRYLSMSAQLYSGNCTGCHTPPNAVAPGRLADMANSALGKQYVDALRKAKSLTATRTSLKTQAKAKPEDVRLNVLLYHLELDAKDRPAALRHLDRLKAADKKHAAAQN